MNRTPDPCPPYAPAPPPDPDNLTGIGYLTVSAGTAHHAYPLPDVQIEIYLTPSSGSPMRLYRRQISGTDGSGDTVPIPTPAESASLTPDPGYRPYTLALVRVYLRGYQPQEAKEVPIFPGINALQYFDLVPLPESAGSESPTDDLTVVSDPVNDYL